MSSIINTFSALFSVTPDKVSFISAQFIIIFILLYSVFAFTHSNKNFRNGLLTFFSLYLYYRLSGPGIFFLVFITASDFLLAKLISRSNNENAKLRYLLVSIVVDISILAYFKYTNFFLSQYSYAVNPGSTFIPLAIIAPIGISYFVFKSMGYVLDVHRGMIENPEENFLTYLLYTSFFPTIVAGPIARARDVIPQFNSTPVISEKMVTRGLVLILSGVIKKVFIADFISTQFLDKMFESPSYFSGFEGFITLYAVPIQIFCDFSGYTDIAIGLSLLLGIEIKNNFNKPFSAKSITDFWRRWHITLLDWFNEYIFMPLNFSLRRWRKLSTFISIMTVFLISGMWHGAAWTFIIWGVLHGLMLVFEIIFGLNNSAERNNNRYLTVIWALVSFHFIALTFVIFKSPNLYTAQIIFSKIFAGFNFEIIERWFSIYYLTFIIILCGYVIHFLSSNVKTQLLDNFHRLNWATKAIVITFILYIVYQFSAAESKPFIYLEF